MKLFVLLLLSFHVVLLNCSTTISPANDSLECLMLSMMFLTKWDKFVTEVPSVEEAKLIADDCKVPLNCLNYYSNITESEGYGPLDVMVEVCRNYDAFAGPFGECFEQLRERRSSPLVYKCAAYIGSMGDNKTNCEFYKSGKHCAKTLLTDRCGEEVAGMLEEQSNMYMSQFKCANKTTTVATTTGKPTTAKGKKLNSG